MEKETMIRFLTARIAHAKKRADAIKERQGDAPVTTSNYYGGESYGYWTGMQAAYENTLDQLLSLPAGKENTNQEGSDVAC